MTTVPVNHGDIVDIYLTGLGPVASSLAPGEIPAQLFTVTEPPTVTIGLKRVARQDILYCGTTQWAGVDLLRIRYTLDLPEGKQPVTISFGPLRPSEAMLFVAGD